MTTAPLGQKTMPWGNHLLGNSSYYIWAKGCLLTELAEALGITPDQANDKLKAVSGFAPDASGQISLVIWKKIAEAFPGFSAYKYTPYNNEVVLAELATGKDVLVEVDAGPIGNPGGSHWVRYIGNHKLHDPWTATERPTSDFPIIKSYAVISKVVAPAIPTSTPASESIPSETYKGLELSNKESVKAAIDAWADVRDGVYIRQIDHQNMLYEICAALGISATIDIASITKSVISLREDFAKQVQAQVMPTPGTPPTLKDIPAHEKSAVVDKAHAFLEEIKALLGV